MLRIALLALLLAGCTTSTGQALRQGVADKGRAEAAAALNDAEWFMCRAAPVGAVFDRYGQSDERWTSYRGICVQRWAGSTETTPASPE